jgi:predicted histone-like DNA-binding protein
MSVLIKVRKNAIATSKSFGKHFGKVVTTKTMSYRELVKHMSEHNSIYGEDVCEGVAIKLQSCILEQLLEGKKVQFGDLGTFYLAVKSEGTDKEEDFNLGTNIKGLYLRFAPSRHDINDLTSKTLKKRASFMNVKDLVESKTKSTSTDSGSGTTTGGDGDERP